MSTQAILGTRIREGRRQIGMTQAELARRLEISASYMNLIERNKRRIAGPLLRRTAEALGVSLDDLEGAQERRLLDTLTGMAGLPALKAAGVETVALGELIGRYPGWARGIVAMARAEETAQETARALSDQLTHDPFLSQAVHTMLTRIAALSSASEILTEFPDVTLDERRRFDRIVVDESRALTKVGEALASYFDNSVRANRTLTPLDEVEAMFRTHGNRFPDLDLAAARLTQRLDPGTPEQRRTSARSLAAAILQPDIDRIVANQSEIETEAGKARADSALLDYTATAILLPDPLFSTVAASSNYDTEHLARQFNTGFQTICQRMTALDPDEHPSFGYLSANAAGNLLEHLAIEGLSLPRYGIGCPLWILFRAQSAPDMIHAQSVILPNERQFLFLARARRSGAVRFGEPRHFVTDMLVVGTADAERTIYGDALAGTPEKVGPGCRVCPRTHCAHRVEDPLLG
ncbi:MAG: short-chain fatty acyl-CoA regulator family protein [Paracoccaceae bacterium]